MTHNASLRSELDAVSEKTLRRRLGVKWSRYPEGVLAAWVADMDFPVAPAIRQLLGEMVQNSDFGYPMVPMPRELIELFVARMQERNGHEIQPDLVLPLVTVLQGVDLSVWLFSEPGDGVVVQTPIYPPFLSAVDGSGRRLVENPLVRRGSAAGPARPESGANGELGYEIDFDQLKASIDSRTRVLLLCNPHNPTGRVMTRAELEALAELALEHDLVVVADEVHSDLALSGHRHTSIATLSPEVAERTITLTSATKSFNLAGLPCAFAAFGSTALKKRLESLPPHLLAHPGALGIQATMLAWSSGDEWLQEVLRYLEENRALLRDFLAARIPEIVYVPPEATYLSWLDCRGLELDTKPSRFFFKQGQLAFNCGHDFGAPGAGFVRLNFATSKQVLQAVLERMAETVDRHRATA